MRAIYSVFVFFLLGSANSATFEVGSGNWDSVSSWNTNSVGAPEYWVYDNGESPAGPVLLGVSGIVDWVAGDSGVVGNPAAQTGTWSGTLVTDTFNPGIPQEVTGGSITATGVVGREIRGGPNSWWYVQYTDLTIDFAAGTAIAAGGVQCWDAKSGGNILAPISCQYVWTTASDWLPIAGAEGESGPLRFGATFTDYTTAEGAGFGTLQIFHEGYSAPGPGTDYLYTLTVQAVPLPAAVWLFASALVGLGWMRRKVTA